MTMKRASLQKIATAIATIPQDTDNLERDSLLARIAIDDALAPTGIGPNWYAALGALRQFLIDGVPCSPVLVHGNDKLGKRFLAFSSLPGLPFCIGAGDCLNHCYSFKAWRYPWSFVRQCQNAVLLKTATDRHHIRTALDREENPIDFRLYVDGDFSCYDDLTFWMEAVDARRHLATYGYSKSFPLFLTYDAYHTFPPNYVLNLSSGHKFSPKTEGYIRALSCYRGDFTAVKTGKGIKANGSVATARAVKQAYGSNRIFVCPGKCSTCTPSGHACGSMKFKGIPIVIPVH